MTFDPGSRSKFVIIIPIVPRLFNIFRTIRVRSEEELNDVAHMLLDKPFLTDIRWEKVEVCFPARVYTAEGNAFVYVNTLHRTIRDQINEGLDEAKRLMRDDKKFFLQFDFKKSMSAYFCEKIQIRDDEDHDRLEDCRCGYGKIAITNCSKYSPLFKFEDKVCPLWVICSPLCLLTLPCYLIYRKLTCNDMHCDVKSKPLPIPYDLEEDIVNKYYKNKPVKNETPTTIVTEPDSSYTSAVTHAKLSNTKITRRRVKKWVQAIAGKKKEKCIDDKEGLVHIL
ncbi:uncharacterized protein LOC102809292 [Saccoglossus kowalevskii]|uniref:Uncharacterized protein LOC102809292 n=1 Tax=Saccoglossus kowalevskii TaxID=10224 RepID=A0ABM0N0J2_SACKO|nr:PREDICTED: uncharacterized protein LOC102809292 [Saccoglossus kowalevskii]